MKNHLIIFVKNPVLGRVKTRLATVVGKEEALRIYLAMQVLTYKAVSPLLTNTHICIYYSDEIVENDIWLAAFFDKKKQADTTDLGARMEAAFAESLAAGAEKVVIIGSDCPTLEATHLISAFAALDTRQVVVGPATDGGYYLLGLRSMQPFLWRNMTWSVPTVCAETLQRLVRHSLSFVLLTPLADVDTYADYLPYQELLAAKKQQKEPKKRYRS